MAFVNSEVEEPGATAVGAPALPVPPPIMAMPNIHKVSLHKSCLCLSGVNKSNKKMK